MASDQGLLQLLSVLGSCLEVRLLLWFTVHDHERRTGIYRVFFSPWVQFYPKIGAVTFLERPLEVHSVLAK